MSVKQTVLEQYQAEVNLAQGGNIHIPGEGWIRTVRKALGMSGAQLGRRMGVTRARIAQAERAELDGGATLKSMKAAAAAMGCEFVYAFVPPDSNIDNVIVEQSRKKAAEIVRRAGGQMALENQNVVEARTNDEIKRLAVELRYEMPSDFWEPA